MRLGDCTSLCVAKQRKSLTIRWFPLVATSVCRTARSLCLLAFPAKTRFHPPLRPRSSSSRQILPWNAHGRLPANWRLTPYLIVATDCRGHCLRAMREAPDKQSQSGSQTASSDPSLPRLCRACSLIFNDSMTQLLNASIPTSFLFPTDRAGARFLRVSYFHPPPRAT